MRFVLTEEAEADLETLGDCVAHGSPLRAAGCMKDIRKFCRSILLAPNNCPVQDDLGEGVRSAVFGGYHVYYVASGEEVRVVRVLAARDGGMASGEGGGRAGLVSSADHMS